MITSGTKKSVTAIHHLTDRITGRSKQQPWVETVTHKGTVVYVFLVPCCSHFFWTCYSVTLMFSVCSFLPCSCCFFRQLVSVHKIHLACMGLQHAIMTIPMVARSVEVWHLSHAVSCLLWLLYLFHIVQVVPAELLNITVLVFSRAKHILWVPVLPD